MICQYGVWFRTLKYLFHEVDLSTRKACWDEDFRHLAEIP